MDESSFFAGVEWIQAGGIALIIVGISLLILEIFLPSLGVFGFAGAASVLIGTVQLHQSGFIKSMPISENTLIILAIIGALLSFIGGIYGYIVNNKKGTTGAESMIGETATVLEWRDKTGRVHIQGEDWQAYADTPLPLHKNDSVIVEKINGLKLKIISKNI